MKVFKKICKIVSEKYVFDKTLSDQSNKFTQAPKTLDHCLWWWWWHLEGLGSGGLGSAKKKCVNPMILSISKIVYFIIYSKSVPTTEIGIHHKLLCLEEYTSVWSLNLGKKTNYIFCSDTVWNEFLPQTFFLISITSNLIEAVWPNLFN